MPVTPGFPDLSEFRAYAAQAAYSGGGGYSGGSGYSGQTANPKAKTGSTSWEGLANAATTYDGIPGAVYSAYVGRAWTSDLRFRSTATWSAKQNLQAGSNNKYNMERYGGDPVPTSQLKDNVAFTRGRLRLAAGVSRLGLPTSKVGWGLAGVTTLASGVVPGYETYQSTGNLGEAAAVGGASSADSFISGALGAAAGDLITSVLTSAAVGAEVGSWARPVGIVAGAGIAYFTSGPVSTFISSLF